MTKPRIEHTQIREDFSDGADGGTRAAIGEILIDADRGRQPFDHIDRRTAHIGNHPQRFHVLPLAFFVQYIKREGRFAGTGDAGQDDDLIFRDTQGDVL
jgi:hypothetical protein